MMVAMWRRRSVQIPFMYMIVSFFAQNVQPWILKSATTQQPQCSTLCFNHHRQRCHGTSNNSKIFVGVSAAMHLIHNDNSKRASSQIGSTISNNISESTTSSLSMLQRRQNRRDIVNALKHGIAATILFGFNAESAVADTVDTVNGDVLFRREMNEFRYEIHIPSNMSGPNQKPLKTHFDEVNFKSMSVPGFEIGITVDPVRIESLIDFGTPEEIAAKVVLAEVNRDGVLEVKLLDDPVSGTVRLNDDNTSTTYYQLNYVSNGKRGRKRYIAKFYVQNHMLLALTAQCKDDTYESIQKNMNNAVTSFQVI